MLGRASLSKGIITLHAPLLEEFGKKYINEVLVHEIAHHIVHQLYPNRTNPKRDNKRVYPHGVEFKQVCKVLGIEGKASTNLFTNSDYLKKKGVVGKCSCQTHLLTRAISNMIANKETIKCKRCNKKIKLIKT